MPYYSHILPPSFFVFLVILAMLLVHILTDATADYDRYNACSVPIPCGNIDEMTYPFWGSVRPEYCGHPGFELINCGREYPEIKIMSLNYRVLQVNQMESTLTVAQADNWSTLCPAYPVNTTLNTTYLDYSPHNQELFLYYDCELALEYLNFNQFPCNASPQGFSNITVREDNHNSTIPICKESLILQVSETAYLYDSNTSLISAINSGFGLEWKASISSICDDCQRSGGQCGSDSASGKFTCHCKDRSYQSTCGSDSEPDFVDEQFLQCNVSFECGHLKNLSYPFWGGSRPEYCGHPDFKLIYCDGFISDPYITTMSQSYQVVEINRTTHSIKIRPGGRFSDFMMNFICPAEPHNLTIPSAIFDISWDTQYLTLYFNCSRSSNVSLALETDLQNYCDFSNKKSYLLNFFLTGKQKRLKNLISIDGIPLNDIIRTCNSSLVLPVNGSAVDLYLDVKTSSDSMSIHSLSLIALIETLESEFWLKWKLPNPSRCDDCRSSGGVCGYDSSSREFTCYCRDRPHQFTCNQNSGSSLKRNWTIGISATLFGIIVISSLIVCKYKSESLSSQLFFWKEDQKEEFDVESFLSNYGSFASKRYTYAKVKKMTNLFVEKIGNGGYGVVYKGKLPDGSLVAVKMLKESKGNGEEFINEVASISTTSHINIVTFIGFCYERNKRALIYEYMPNGSLDKFIFNQESSNTSNRLEWKTLYEIAVGIARGLEYLHRGCSTRILHFDIKPHNILLDNDFCPKISDFGLAKLCQRDNSIVSMLGARGTFGYVAPEIYCRNFGGVSYKSDVYSYGMMVLEMVGGRRNIDVGASRTSEIYFPNWLYKHIEDGEILKLSEEMTIGDDEIARKMILVSLWCIQTRPSNRPSMTKVVEMLEGSLQSLQIPPKPTLSLQKE